MDLFIKYFCLMLALAFISIESINASLYNWKNEICCDGVVHAFENEKSKPLCCGTKIINDYNNNLCCNGTVQPKPNYDWECCGSRVIHLKNTICGSNGVPVPIAEEVILGHKSICAKSPDKYELYNNSEKICCNGVLTDRIGKMSCCSHIAYDMQRSLCCPKNKNYSVVNLPKDRNDHVCCGNTFYHSASQICCDGTPVDKLNPNAHECCGKTSYDREASICCVNRVFDVGNYRDWSCCGGKPYEFRKQVCCGGNRLRNYDQKDGLAVCCGDEIISSTDILTKACINDVVYKLDENHDVCIDWLNKSSVSLYNIHNQICCLNGPIYVDVVYVDEVDNTVKPLRKDCCHSDETLERVHEIINGDHN